MISKPVLDPGIPLLQVFGMSLDLGQVLILREDIARLILLRRYV